MEELISGLLDLKLNLHRCEQNIRELIDLANVLSLTIGKEKNQESEEIEIVGRITSLDSENFVGGHPMSLPNEMENSCKTTLTFITFDCFQEGLRKLTASRSLGGNKKLIIKSLSETK